MRAAPPAAVQPGRDGFLQLSADQEQRLISSRPIGELYDVEEEPFARGKFAAVRRCRPLDAGAGGWLYAAKFLRKWRRAVDLRPDILHEIAILDACSLSSRVVKLHGVFESDQEMVLLLELAQGGELQALLDKDVVPEEALVRNLMLQILQGLLDLHNIHVAHLDIKPQNLVLTGDFPQCEVKLCDLGIARYVGDGADVREIMGTPDYVAPEVLNYEPISLATDMWSVGVLIYVLLTGCSPFGGDSKLETFANISKCILDFPEELFEDISEEAKDLMRKLMVKEPSRRLTVQQALEHPWFNVDLPPPAPPPPDAPKGLVTLKGIKGIDRAEGARMKPDRPSPTPMRKPGKEMPEGFKGDSPPIRPPTRILPAPAPIPAPTPPTPSPTPTVAPTPEEKGEKTATSGMTSFRRTNFKRNMGSILERVTSCEDILNHSALAPAPTLSPPSAPALAQLSELKPFVRSKSESHGLSELSVSAVSQSKAVTVVSSSGINSTAVTYTSIVSKMSYSGSAAADSTPSPRTVQTCQLRVTSASRRLKALEAPATPVNPSRLSRATAAKTVNLGQVREFRRRFEAASEAAAASSSVDRPPALMLTPAASEPPPTSATRAPLRADDCVYSFRKCFIVDEGEAAAVAEGEAAASLASDGSNESETSSGYYDNSSCCSSSDSVSDASEATADALADRCSSASMDSLDSCYGKERPPRGASKASAATRCGDKQPPTATRPTPLGTLAPQQQLQQRFGGRLQPSLATPTARPPAPPPPPLPLATPNAAPVRKECALNVTRDAAGKVLLQEVKAGRSTRFGQLKMESVKSRMRIFES